MPHQTLQSQLAALLLSKGYHELPNYSRKYRVFTATSLNGKHIFLGKHGSLRVGRTITASIPVYNLDSYIKNLTNQ